MRKRRKAKVNNSVHVENCDKNKYVSNYSNLNLLEKKKDDVYIAGETLEGVKAPWELGNAGGI